MAGRYYVRIIKEKGFPTDHSLELLFESIDQGKKKIYVNGLHGSAKSFLLASLFQKITEPLVVICASEKDARTLLQDLSFFLDDDQLFFYPAWDAHSADLFAFQKDLVLHRMLYDNEFSGTAINTDWSLFNNPNWQPATAANSDNIHVNNGLHLMLSRNSPGSSKAYTGAGLDNSASVTGSQVKTGYWEVKARFPQSNLGVVGYISLYPSNNMWFPEIDFAETDGIRSGSVTFTQHWGLDNQMDYHTLPIDPTQFHTYGVEITPDSSKLNWYIDGNLIISQTYQSPGQAWKFSLGTYAGDCSGSWGGCPTNTPLPVYIDVNYIRIYNARPW